MGRWSHKNSEGLQLNDFLFLNIKGNQFCMPKDTDGLFSITLLHATKEYNLMLPSLGDIVDYINQDRVEHIEFVKNYLEQNQIITSTYLDIYSGHSEFSGILEKEADITIRETTQTHREKLGLDDRVHRGNCTTFGRFNVWLDMQNESEVTYKDKRTFNIVKSIFNKPYEEVMSALDKIAQSLPKKLFLPSYSDNMNVPDLEPILAIAKRNNELIVVKHNVCSGEFCVRD